MQDSRGGMKFDLAFWKEKFRELGYGINPREYDVESIKERGFIPRGGLSVEGIWSLFENGLLEIVVVKVSSGLSRGGRCVQMARKWVGTGRRPIMVHTDGKDSYLAIAPEGEGGSESLVKMLYLSHRLYHTDMEALSSMRYLSTKAELYREYNEEFLPYGKVRYEFFQEYRSKFLKLSGMLKGGLLGGERRANEYAQRFLGRLMFLYFLQKKGWLAGDRDFISGIEDYKGLNRVFYEGLNNPPRNTMNLPFLNGSLFDKEEYVGELEKKMEAEITEFFREAREFFNRYNFTVDEFTPLEREVGIDPYLLGTVFENMLPENERGGSKGGTFYTPPSEIRFIIRRALANYLKLKVGGFETGDKVQDGKFMDGIDAYIGRLKETGNMMEMTQFKDAILDAVVVDPAVGSGGFIVYYMDEAVRIIQEAEAAVGLQPSQPDELKYKIMANLYGFDIETEAVEIARLRVWLSYVINKEKPVPLPPNLDLNIMVVQDSLMKVLKRLRTLTSWIR